MNKQFIIYLLAAIVFPISGQVQAQETAQSQPNVMFCTDTYMNGFRFNPQTRRYESATFLTTRYTVNIIGSFDSLEITSPGETTLTRLSCVQNVLIPTIYHCISRTLGSFVYNTQTQGYSYARQFGYTASEGDSVSVSIGSCQRF